VKDWLALRPLFILLGMLAISLLAIGLVVSMNEAHWIIPSPESVSEQFVDALAARRFHAARDQLSQDMKKQVAVSDLSSLVETIQRNHKGIQEAYSISSQEQENEASASVVVQFGDGTAREVNFSLVKEHGLWKLSSFEPIDQFAQPNPQVP
jgi:hypothetical protein